MVSHAALAGLILDGAGAVLLARAAIFERPRDYVKGRGTPKYNYDAGADTVRAKDGADARVGAALLFLGFAGQGVAAAGGSVCPLVAYLAAGVVLALALPAWRRGRARFEVEMLRARLQQIEDRDGLIVYENGASVIEHYAEEMRGLRRGADESLDAFAANAFGRNFWRPLTWATVERHPELFQTPAEQEQSWSRSPWSRRT